MAQRRVGGSPSPEGSLPDRLDARCAVEKVRKLAERDRVLRVEVAGRVAFPQKLCERRLASAGGAANLRKSIFFPGQFGRTAGSGAIASA